MALIQDDIFNDVVDEVYNQLSNASVTYNGTELNAFINVMTENEKRVGLANSRASSDIEIEVKKSDLDAIISTISKADVIAYNGISYDNVTLTESTDYDYILIAYRVLT